ncbi:MAG: TetR/AcrR family transcriptional regulator [Acidimicrobiales bacterium]
MSSADETPAPRKRPGGRTARTGAAVLAATLEILANDGFAALTVDAVAERAGVHRTTVYRRWGTRERLVVDALASQGTTEIPIPDTGTIQGDTEAIARMVAANLASPLGRALAQGMVGHGDDDEIRRVTEEFWRTRFELTSVLVHRAVERRELPEGTDSRLVVELVVATVWFRSIVTRSAVDDALIAQITDVVIKGFGNEDP